jgi:hypothetical protein
MNLEYIRQTAQQAEHGTRNIPTGLEEANVHRTCMYVLCMSVWVQLVLTILWVYYDVHMNVQSC